MANWAISCYNYIYIMLYTNLIYLILLCHLANQIRFGSAHVLLERSSLWTWALDTCGSQVNLIKFAVTWISWISWICMKEGLYVSWIWVILSCTELDPGFDMIWQSIFQPNTRTNIISRPLHLRMWCPWHSLTEFQANSKWENAPGLTILDPFLRFSEQIPHQEPIMSSLAEGDVCLPASGQGGDLGLSFM